MAAISMSSSLWPAELNIVTIRVPTRKADGDDQAVQWTLRNDTTAGQLLSSLCEVLLYVKRSNTKITTCFLLFFPAEI